jgi:DNA-binding MarR family transcriptional regulator
MSPTDPATRRIMDALRRIVRGLSASARGGGNAGVTGAQLFVLRQVAAAPGLTVGELAARTLTGQSTVSEVVTKLVDARLVARATSPQDARQVRLTLTARGRRTIAGLEPTAQERLANGLGTLSAARRAALADALDVWLAASGLEGEAPTMFFEEHPPARRRP